MHLHRTVVTAFENAQNNNLTAGEWAWTDAYQRLLSKAFPADEFGVSSYSYAPADGSPRVVSVWTNLWCY